MADDLYLANRLKYHTASRIGIQDGQSLSQATNPDGHIVTKGQIWTAESNEFPHNTGSMRTTSDGTAATKNLIAVFAQGTGFKKVTFSPSGEVSYEPVPIDKGDDKSVLAQLDKLGDNIAYECDDYPAVRLYYHAKLERVEFSNDQSYEHFMYGKTRAMDWVAPTAVKDNGLPVPGFSGYGEALIGDTWKPMEDQGGWDFGSGNWEFVYISGMLTMSASHKISTKGASEIRYTAFQYIGSRLDKTIKGIDDKIAAANTNTSQNMLACRMFPFKYSDMTDGDKGLKTIDIPAIVFNVFNTKTGMAYGDLTYNTNGSTTITFEPESPVAIDGTMTGEGDGFVALGFTKGDNSQMEIVMPSNWNKGQGMNIRPAKP